LGVGSGSRCVDSGKLARSDSGSSFLLSLLPLRLLLQLLQRLVLSGSDEATARLALSIMLLRIDVQDDLDDLLLGFRVGKRECWDICVFGSWLEGGWRARLLVWTVKCKVVFAVELSFDAGGSGR